MKKQEYLSALREKMRDYPVDFQNEICDAFESHFAEGLENGQSEDEIIDSLGSVDDVMDNIRMMNPDFATRYQREDDLRTSLNNLSSSLRDTLRSVSSVVADSANIAVKNLQSYSSDDTANETEGSLDVTDGTVLKIKGSLHGALDVCLEAGSRLAYRFKPMRSLFSSSTANLQVSQNDGTVLFDTDDSARLWIEIPREIENIQIDLLSGDVEVRNLTAGSLHGKTTSGDWNFDDCSIRLLSVETKSGDIDLASTECTDIQLVTFNGDLSLRETSGDLSAKNASGDIELVSHTANTIKAETRSGDLDINARCPRIELWAASGDIELDACGHIENISCTASSGDISARIEDTDYTAVLHTISGDITNATPLSETRRSSGKQIIGSGPASVVLKTASGDIDIA